MKKHKYKKELQKLAQELGLDDTTVLAGYGDIDTKQTRFELTNNARRFVRGILTLPEEEQLFRINRLKAVVAEQKLREVEEGK
jgi:2-hydroxychromene-2-carboxylate isomerase